jgi:hypothetical protein
VEPLPPPLEEKRRALSRSLGRPVVVRGIQTPDRALRGRLTVTPDRVLIEYQVPEAGYFWHIPIIEELFDRAGSGPPAGRCAAEVRETACGDEAERPGR